MHWRHCYWRPSNTLWSLGTYDSERTAADEQMPIVSLTISVDEGRF